MMKSVMGKLSYGALAVAFCLCAMALALRAQTGGNVLLQWDTAALQAVRMTRLGPPMTALAMAHTAMFDAWASMTSTSAEILKLFTGSYAFNVSAKIAPGSSKVEPGVMPAAEITLSWKTFTEAAEEAGISRCMAAFIFLTPTPKAKRCAAKSAPASGPERKASSMAARGN